MILDHVISRRPLFQRQEASPPFTVTGMDFAGPLFCADFPSSKFYVLLFTCAVVRAIHLELTDSMSLSDCLCAIRRFISRRDLPFVIYSDNFKTFVASAQRVQEVYGHLAPQWKFFCTQVSMVGRLVGKTCTICKTCYEKDLGW